MNTAIKLRLDTLQRRGVAAARKVGQAAQRAQAPKRKSPGLSGIDAQHVATDD